MAAKKKAPAKKAAPSVPIVRPVNLKTMSTVWKRAPNAPLGFPKVTPINQGARNVAKEKKHQRSEAVFARRVIWVNLIWSRAKIVWTAPSGNTKTAKVKQRAKNATRIPT